jgi:hypothetical protein
MAARIPAGGGRRGFAPADRGERGMNNAEDARARELHNLRLALATFAVQLEAFELRAKGAVPAAVRGIAGRVGIGALESEGVGDQEFGDHGFGEE